MKNATAEISCQEIKILEMTVRNNNNNKKTEMKNNREKEEQGFFSGVSPSIY